MSEAAEGVQRPLHRWLTSISLMLAVVIEVLDVTVANVSLPHMQASFSASTDEVTWVLTSYLVSTGVVVPMTGWLSALIGGKRLLVGSTLVFTAASALCGLAWDLPSMVLFRVMQGVGGAALMPLSQTMIRGVFPPEQQGLGMALWGIGVMVAPILGPTLGGYLTDNYHWRWIFFINLPLGLTAAALQMAFLRPDPPSREGRAANRDYLGLLLVALSVGCLQIVLDRGERADWFASTWVWVFTAISFASTAFFIPWELRHREPVMDLRLLRDRSFAAAQVITILVFIALYSNFIIFGFFLQLLLGYPAMQAGMIMSPRGVATMFAMLVVGMLYRRIDPRILMAFGVTLVAAGSLAMAGWSDKVSTANMLPMLLVTGLGIGFTFVPLSTVSVSSVAEASVANASAIYSLMRNIGSSLGITISSTLLVRWAQVHQAALSTQVQPTSMAAWMAGEGARAAAARGGADAATAAAQSHALVYGMVVREANLLAFRDVFLAAGYLTLLALPCILLLRRPQALQPPGEIH